MLIILLTGPPSCIASSMPRARSRSQARARSGSSGRSSSYGM